MSSSRTATEIISTSPVPDTSTTTKQKPDERVYFENLDGLRFWAFAAVFVAHIGLFKAPGVTVTPFVERLGQ